MIKRFGLLYRTVLHLKSKQISSQIFYRIRKEGYKQYFLESFPDGIININFIFKPNSTQGGECYYFLNILHKPTSWNDASQGMLWAYNLNYMDYLLQPGMKADEGVSLILKFIDELPHNKVGLDPYPIALRGINWIKWIAVNGKELDIESRKKINDSLYSQYLLLERKLEYHLLGNHLLEDAFSLTIGAIYFADKRMWEKASRLLLAQLKEQTLDDGAHFEQSPMYHCILLDRLLDVYNFSLNNERFGYPQTLATAQLKQYAVAMLGHLESIVWSDGSIPLLNDSAYGIAPTANEIKEYASHLGLEWKALPMKESGYRKFASSRIEAIADIGNITATYQPGHTHADTFNYELRIDGKPFIIDTGISTYNKTARRQYERGTSAHNTVTIGDRDSSEVWGGFRVGKRAKVKVEEDTPKRVKASHDGYKPNEHTRTFEIDDDMFRIVDETSGNETAVSRIHFAPEVQITECQDSKIKTNLGEISIEGADEITIVKDQASKEYNLLEDISVAEIRFTHKLSYTIFPKV